MAGHAGGERPFDTRTVAAKSKRRGDFGIALFGVREKPADVRKLIGAGYRFSRRHFRRRRRPKLRSSAVENSGQHSFAQFRKQRADI